MDLAAIDRKITEVHREKKWIIAADAAAAAHHMVERLQADDPAGVMVVAGIEGVGDLPDAERIHYTRSSGTTLMEGVRAFLTSIEQPSPELLAAVDAFDPDAEARVLGQGFSRKNTLAGREVYGRRPRPWRQLEDKTIVDALWDDAGVKRAPSAIVPVPEAATNAAQMATAGGTVWAADNRTGWHGGGEYTRWITGDTDLDEAQAWFSHRADRVRVMPFLEGVPCSIHAFVTTTGVAVFLPVELFILRRTDPPGFVYAQGANFWSPPDEIAGAMRTAARSVGDLLAHRMGYLGGFVIDGIATEEGFLPTELNPRLTLGHMMQGRSSDVPLGPMERMLLEGDLVIDAADLEGHVTEVVEHQRGGGMMFTTTKASEPDEACFRFTDSGIALTNDIDDATGRMSLGPAAFGSLVVVSLDPDHIPIGPLLAPRAVQLMDVANGLWNLDLPSVTAAADPFALSS